MWRCVRKSQEAHWRIVGGMLTTSRREDRASTQTHNDGCNFKVYAEPTSFDPTEQPRCKHWQGEHSGGIWRRSKIRGLRGSQTPVGEKKGETGKFGVPRSSELKGGRHQEVMSQARNMQRDIYVELLQWQCQRELYCTSVMQAMIY